MNHPHPAHVIIPIGRPILRQTEFTGKLALIEKDNIFFYDIKSPYTFLEVRKANEQFVILYIFFLNIFPLFMLDLVVSIID